MPCTLALLDLSLSDYDASQLTANKVTSDFLELRCTGGDAKQFLHLWLRGVKLLSSERRRQNTEQNWIDTVKLGGENDYNTKTQWSLSETP